MLAYVGTKRKFLGDAPRIEDIVRSEVKRTLGINVGESEYRAWRNSLGNAMSHVMLDPGIPDDAAVAVEYRLNGRKFRIDFLVGGADSEARESLVVIELKQWEEILESELPSHVRTFVGGAIREERHPSYQAWSYATHLQQYNEYVYSNDVQVASCAYVHNCQTDKVLRSSKFREDLSASPVFIKGEIEGVQRLIRSRVVEGLGTDLLDRVDKAPIRPSRQLAEAIGSMLDGNQEFVLLDEQKTVLETIINRATRGMVDGKQVLVIKGGPGTGKSVIAINALSRLSALRMNVRYVTPNAAPRTVFETKLKGVLPGVTIGSLFSGSGGFVGIEPDSYDVLIVDEAHRLKLRTQYAKGGENQIKEIIESARTVVFFIDEAQKVTWQDIGEIAAIEEYAASVDADVDHLELVSQFRCGGSDDYLDWLDSALGIRLDRGAGFSRERFDFRVIRDPNQLRELVRERNRANNKSRIVAGYCWDWKSQKDPRLSDIVIPEFDFQATWNLASHQGRWIVEPDSFDQIGCIHTCQGLELDYVGVIVGPDLAVDGGELVTVPEERAKTDRSLRGYKKERGVNPEAADRKADELIRNTYRTLMSRGMKGCYVYCTDDRVADYIDNLLSGDE